MRVIKFRAWESEKNLMVYANAGIYGFMTYDGCPVIISPNGLPLENKGYALMQFTGLLDKNGKEIYEGDILMEYPGFGCEWSKRKGVVMYKGASFWLDHGTISFVLDDHDCSLEVIGNIHENPEFLKSK